MTTSTALQNVRTGLAISAWELRLCIRRFSWWLLVIVALGLGYLFCTPWLRLFSGDGPQTQTVPIARNSAYALSMAMTALAFLTAPFVASISAESAVRDARVRLLPLAMVTPVSRVTYLLAKCAAAVLASLGPLLAFLAGVSIAQVLARDDRLLLPPNVVGPLSAFLQFGLPFMCLTAVVCFCVVVLTGEPRRAYVAVTLLAGAELALYAAAGRPELRWLSAVDPLGLLRLIDIGASGLSNPELSALTWPGGQGLLANRIVFLAAAAAFVLPAARALPQAGDMSATRRRWQLNPRAAWPAFAAARRTAQAITSRIAAGRRSSFAAVTIAELRLARNEQSLLIFLPLFIALAWFNMGQPIGPFNIDAIPITAVLAQQNLWILVASLVAFGSFLITESALRDSDRKIDHLIRLTRAPATAMLGGKLFANVVVAGCLLLVGCATILSYQWVNGGHVRIRPLVDLYGGIALTTVLVALCLTLVVATITRSRHASYAFLVLATALYGYAWFKGYVHWLYNLPGLDLFVYSEIAGFGLVDSTVLVHRLYAVFVAALLFWGSVCIWKRRDLGGRATNRWTLGAGAALMAGCVGLGGVLWWRVEDGMWSSASNAARASYERSTKPWLARTAQPQVSRMNLDVDLYPETQEFAVRGAHTLENTHDHPVPAVFVTVNPRLLANGSMDLDGRAPDVILPGLLKFPLDAPMQPGATVTLRYRWRARAPDGVPPFGDRYTAFVDRRATLLTTMSAWSWLPTIGYSTDAELMGPLRKTYGLRPARAPIDRYADGDTSPIGLMRRNIPYWFEVKIRAPKEQRVVATGQLLGSQRLGDRVEYVFASERPIYLAAISAGRWLEQSDGSNTVLYDPQHSANVAQILRTVRGARELYSTTFGPYPFSSLTVAELPQMNVWAGMGFPGLIPLSEDIAFLTRETRRRANVNVFIIAHEVAHEWWGQTLWPAHARGAQSLIEGLATYSAMLMVERTLGETRRRALFEDLEYYYLTNRSPDQEESLAHGIRGEGATKYHRAGIVLYMLSRQIGVERFLEILREFCQRHAFTREHPTFAGLLRLVEDRSPEARPFIDEYIRGTAVPRLEYSNVAVRPAGQSRWHVGFTLTNSGTGTITVDVAARGTGQHESRVTVTIAPKASVTTTIESDFRPRTLRFDPDTTVLLQNRSQSVYPL